MLSWDEQSDNKATSLVNKRWAHKPEGRGSSYFSMMTVPTSSLTAPCSRTHTLTNTCTNTHKAGKHRHIHTHTPHQPFAFYCTLSLCTVWWSQLHSRSPGVCINNTHTQTHTHMNTNTHSVERAGGVCQAEEALCQSSVRATTGEGYQAMSETL